MKASISTIVALLGEIFAVLCASTLAAPAAGEPLSALDAIAGLPLHAVSAPIRLTIAGRPAVLRVVRGRDNAEAVAAAARSEWTKQGAQVRQDNEGPWRSVSRVGSHGIDVLQLRDATPGSSNGYLVGWQLDTGADASAEIQRPTLAHRLVPRSAVILSDVASGAVARGRTVVAWLPGDLDEADRILLSSASALGLEQRKESRRAAAGLENERARFFSDGNKELALTLHREGTGTALVIHLMETTR